MEKLTGTTLKYNLFYSKGRVLDIYRKPSDVKRSYKLIEDIAKKNPEKILENMGLFEEKLKYARGLMLRIKKINSKKELGKQLIELDATFFEVISYYLFVVFMGYAADNPSIKKLIKRYNSQFEKIRMSTMDLEIHKELPVLFGKYDKRFKEHILYMRRREVLNLLNNRKVNWSKVKNRHKESLLIVNNNIQKEYQLSQIPRVVDRELSHIKFDSQAKIIKGLTAFKGQVEGNVVRVITKDDYAKIKKGDILVTTMTKPDIVFLLNKVKGIITNDGGALCHASIIAREMKIPCVVGTVNATAVLKDGEKILLNASRGIVFRNTLN